ncbi:MAG TPA: YciI family protein [Herbaspirillum sp.]
MRFMILVKADRNSEAGIMPDRSLLAAMGKYNETLVKAGVLLAAEGLHPSVKGARVKFSGGSQTVTDGPFNAGAGDVGELLAGFWLIQVSSKAEAIEWVKRCPMGDGAELEIRQVFEADDFGAALTPEQKQQEADLRTRLATRH